jgi:hypothetical protein
MLAVEEIERILLDLNFSRLNFTDSLPYSFVNFRSQMQNVTSNEILQ